MLIQSFKIDHANLKPGCYLHDVKRIKSSYITTFDLRFKKPNKGIYLNNSEMHSLEHLLATFYTENYPEKIYFGPMGCQTGFYLVVYGKKTLRWLLRSLPKLDEYIENVKQMPGCNPHSCGNYRSLNLKLAKICWRKWYDSRDKWGTTYDIIN